MYMFFSTIMDSISVCGWTHAEIVTYLLPARHDLHVAPDILLLLRCGDSISENAMCPIHDPAKQKEKD
jgi:hypothetical protein